MEAVGSGFISKGLAKGSSNSLLNNDTMHPTEFILKFKQINSFNAHAKKKYIYIREERKERHIEVCTLLEITEPLRGTAGHRPRLPSCKVSP